MHAIGVADILAWLAVGLVAGAIARLVTPGHLSIGCLGTAAVGLAGSVVGGFLFSLLRTGHGTFSPAGFLGSIVGAVLVLLVLRAIAGRR